MRRTGVNGWIMQVSSKRAVQMAAVAAGIAVVLASGVARAQDDDKDDSTFEEKIIKGIMTGIGGTNVENSGINYRERSPLVIPPKNDLPPPATASTEINSPNWPKDPDVQRRRAEREANRRTRPDPIESARTLTPSELNVGRRLASKSTGNDPVQPGQNGNPILSPSQLGYKGGVFGIFKGNQSESAPFTGEPTRESLTQPPVGYQTPSPNFAYGTGPKESLNTHEDIMSGKEVKN